MSIRFLLDQIFQHFFRIYAVGGRDSGQCLRTVEYYSPHTNKWMQCAQMTKRRGFVGVGVLHGYIYAAGGLDTPTCHPSSTRLCCVERYFRFLICSEIRSILTYVLDMIPKTTPGLRWRI